MYSIYDCLGQPSFSFRIPSAPLRTFLPVDEGRFRFTDESRYQFVNEVHVRAQTQNRIWFEGDVPRTRVDAAVNLLRSIDFVPNRPGIFYFALTTTGGRSLWSGYMSQGMIDQVVQVLRTGIGKGYEIWPEPGRDYRIRGASAQVRTRGGFATLFGVAAGYALGGVPGAMVGAAISRVL
jgi:hypothetical protein